MTTFPINIQVSNGGAKSAIGGVTTALKGAEAAGTSAGKAIGDGLDKASVSGQKAIANAKLLGQSLAGIARGYVQMGLGSVSNAFAGLNEQLEREARLFDAIRSPMREYQADVFALQKLHARGKLSAAEYAIALQEAGHRTGGGSVSVGGASAAASLGGRVDNAAGSLIGKASAALAIGYGLEKTVDFADSIVGLNNKLTGTVIVAGKASMSVGDLRDRLYDVAQATHADMDATVSSFTSISTASKALGLTQMDVLDLTETLNKAIVVSGVSSEEASNGLRQLGQALASGRLQGDEFRSMSENFPYLMNTIATALNVPIGQLRTMASEGQLTASVVVGALQKSADGIDQSFAQMTTSVGGRLTQLKNFAKSIGGDIFDYFNDKFLELDRNLQSMNDSIGGAAQRLASAYADASRQGKGESFLDALAKVHPEQVAILRDHLTSLKPTAAEAKKQFEAMNDTIQQMLSKVAAADPAFVGMQKAQEDFKNQTKALNTEIEIQNKLLAEAAKYGNHPDNWFADRGLVPPSQAKAARDAAKDKLDQLKNPTIELEKPATMAATGIDYYKKVLDDIKQPGLDFRGSMTAANGLLVSGAINANQYADAVKKIRDAYASTNPVFKLINDATTVKYGGGPSHNKQVADAEYRLSQEELNRGGPDEPNLEADLAAQAAREQAARKSPMDRAHDQTNEAIKAMNEGRLSASSYADELNRIQVEYLNASGEAKTFAGGAELAFMDLAKQADDVGASIRESIVGGVHAVEDALVQLVTKGKVDWAGLIDSMVAGLARLAVQQAIGGIASLAAGGPGGSATASAENVSGLANAAGAILGAVTRTSSDVTPQLPAGAAGAMSSARQAPVAVHVHPDIKGALMPALDSPSGRRRVARIVLKDTPIAAALRSRNQ